MKFVFEAKASDYDLAAEQEILLRHVSNRKRNWTRAVILCAATVVLCILLVMFGQTGTKETLQVMALVVGVILFQQGYLDYTSGNPKAFLKLLYRGRRDQTYADLNKVLRIEITEDSPAVEIYNEDGKVGEWDFQNLNRVTESDRIFELCRGGGRSRQYLALPKDALREGTVEEFRSCMDRWLKGDKTTTANYIIMASTCAPILINGMSMHILAANMFVFYFGIVADITPPVALAAYAGAAIAKAPPMKTALNATRLAIAAFIIPYIFAYNNAMIFVGDVTFLGVASIVISATLGMASIASGFMGYLIHDLKWYSRIALVAGGLLMVIPGTVTDLAGLAILIVILLIQKAENKKEKKAAV